MRSIGQIIFGFVAFFAICMLSSCDHPRESIPRELIDVDSALMKGDYRKAEILLDEYEDQLSGDESEEVLMYQCCPLKIA